MAEIIEVMLRLMAALVLGGMVGLNRNLHHKSVGLRTLAIVSFGSALFVLAVVPFPGTSLSYDASSVSRVVQGIVAGIGFLGAGCIVRPNRGGSVHGFTTAAALWSTTGIGIICGLGRWHIAVAAMVLLLIVLAVGGPIEDIAHRWLGHDEPEKGASGASREASPDEDVPARHERDGK
ncbi:MgtC/SapB family protein [Pandoraea nosoerga]|uniref:Protein MgtC n=1 Tax=Pandoraea nosoerga TaxID=2508296 RepID=A0A5E4TMA0_9BURK|nr:MULTISPECIES: MgtC/SapB family protein [Pandoraea]MBN4665545.1 MgtC/SapB family protein [Pandoraea nosoerga]MBN4675070.1 MgtC/SapB family protein [Pandoraea nosoerga]MBN4680386.1 MgtC/SapB family protein [Pandoraea nosoerga]MBN4745536.1 MgtC/SapB family protein [Pandoraea nosoerga]VVD88402.1 MgtC/SapB family protein [Pandoraea nosoerga]